MPSASPPGFPQISVREWAYVRTELQWIYDHAVFPEFRSLLIQKTDAYAAWYLRSGRVSVETEAGERFTARAGQWLMAPKTRFHQRFSNDARILSLHFVCEWPSGDPILTTHGGLVMDGEQCPELEAIGTTLERLVRSHTPEGAARYHQYFCGYPHFLEAHSLMLRWLGYWFTVQLSHGAESSRLAIQNERVVHALRCLNNAPLHRPLPYKDLQRLTGLSLTHLNRLLHTHNGSTVRKIWDTRRLNQARSLLETGQIPIKELSYTLGFLSDSHFSKWFKAHTAENPKAYRDRVRAEQASRE